MIKIYSLFYHDKLSSKMKPVNLPKTQDSPNEIYLKIASLLQSSLKRYGYDHKVLTNDGSIFDIYNEKNDIKIKYEVIPLKWKFPPHIDFYSAHFKLELFEIFASGLMGDKILLLDLDMVATSSFKDIISNLSNLGNDVLVYYDVGNIEFDFNLKKKHAHAISSLCNQNDINKNFFWAGGEFIYGSPESFSTLNNVCKTIIPKYLSSLGSMPHIGDEMVVNAALREVSSNIECLEISVVMKKTSSIVRFWSAGTKLKLPRFKEYKGVGLFHFPADKEFLARMSNMAFDIGYFLNEYQKYLRKKSILRRLTYLFFNLFRPKRFPPRL
jgi:hypothetical protein